MGGGGAVAAGGSRRRVQRLLLCELRRAARHAGSRPAQPVPSRAGRTLVITLPPPGDVLTRHLLGIGAGPARPGRPSGQSFWDNRTVTSKTAARPGKTRAAASSVGCTTWGRKTTCLADSEWRRTNCSGSWGRQARGSPTPTANRRRHATLPIRSNADRRQYRAGDYGHRQSRG